MEQKVLKKQRLKDQSEGPQLCCYLLSGGYIIYFRMKILLIEEYKSGSRSSAVRNTDLCCSVLVWTVHDPELRYNHCSKTAASSTCLVGSLVVCWLFVFSLLVWLVWGCCLFGCISLHRECALSSRKIIIFLQPGARLELQCRPSIIGDRQLFAL